jgi:hypothetical protein
MDFNFLLNPASLFSHRLLDVDDADWYSMGINKAHFKPRRVRRVHAESPKGERHVSILLRSKSWCRVDALKTTTSCSGLPHPWPGLLHEATREGKRGTPPRRSWVVHLMILSDLERENNGHHHCYFFSLKNCAAWAHTPCLDSAAQMSWSNNLVTTSHDGSSWVLRRIGWRRKSLSESMLITCWRKNWDNETSVWEKWFFSLYLLTLVIYI